MDLLAKVWPEWSVEGELGEGSFGKVYKIKRQDIGGTYHAALKVISIPKDKSEISSIMTEGMMDKDSVTHYFQGMMEEIVKEFAMMEKLKGNTNIVAYEDHRVIPHEDNIGWDILIRMELLTPLTDYMTERVLGEKEAIMLGIDICRALELCQKYHIIHRDIKPENIFVSELGDYKLGDFGVARTAEKTMSGMSKKGTYTYMAPEVYKGKAYNATVDLYSLGIVLYRLVNNYRTPFLPPAPQMISFSDKETAQSRRMNGEDLPAPSQASEALTDIIRKACAFDPKERYADATQMRMALECLQRGEAVTSKPPVSQSVVPKNVEPASQPEAKQTRQEEQWDQTVAMTVSTSAAAAAMSGAKKVEAKIEVVEPEPEDKTVSMWNPSEPEDKTVSMWSQPKPEEKTAAKSAGPVQSKIARETADKKSKKGLFIGIGAAAAALLIGGVILLSGSGDSGSSTPAQGGSQGNNGPSSIVQESGTGNKQDVTQDMVADTGDDQDVMQDMVTDVGDEQDVTQDITTEAETDRTYILAQRLSFAEDGKALYVSEGAEADLHDNSMYSPLSMFGEWVPELQVAEGSRMTIAKGTKAETEWECLPAQLNFEPYFWSTEQFGFETVDVENRHLDGMYGGYVVMNQNHSNASSINESEKAAFLYDTSSNTLAIGVLYNEAEILRPNKVQRPETSQYGDVYIHEIQYEMEWVGWKLKLTYGDYSAVYVPKSMVQGTTNDLYTGGEYVGSGEPIDNITYLQKKDGGAGGKIRIAENISRNVTFDFKEDGTVSIFAPEFVDSIPGIYTNVYPEETFNYKYLVSDESITLISGEKKVVYYY